jgi:acetyl-CoA carboxylase / biotin carboxylase 1
VRVLRETPSDDGSCVLLTSATPAEAPNASSGREPEDRQPVLAPVPPLQPLQRRRLYARRHATTYCYDFPAVFYNALRAIWADHGAAPPAGTPLVHAAELVLQSAPNFAQEDAPLAPVSRPVGTNAIGVVAWLLTLRTPEWLEGRRIVAVANDITHGAGAFGPPEYGMFRAACDHAVAAGLPLVYLAANSGARVGLDQALKKALNVRGQSPLLYVREQLLYHSMMQTL